MASDCHECDGCAFLRHFENRWRCRAPWTGEEALSGRCPHFQAAATTAGHALEQATPRALGGNYMRSMLIRTLLGSFILTSIFMIVWSVVVEVVPPGWWVSAMNVMGILFSAAMVLSGVRLILRPIMPGCAVVLVAGVIWIVMFFVWRNVVGLFF